MHTCLLLLIALTISACTPHLTSPSEPTPAPTMTFTSGISTAEADEIIAIAVQDLVTQLSIDPARVRVLSVESNLWPDSALGCTRPGEVYTQQTVPGFLLRLEANGQEFIYHTDQSGTLILCTEDQLPYFPVTPGEIDDEKPWMPVD